MHLKHQILYSYDEAYIYQSSKSIKNLMDNPTYSSCEIFFHIMNWYGNNVYFKIITRGIADGNDLDEDIQRDIGYHINELMDRHEEPATIMETCFQFQARCNDYRLGIPRTNSTTKPAAIDPAGSSTSAAANNNC